MARQLVGTSPQSWLMVRFDESAGYRSDTNRRPVSATFLRPCIEDGTELGHSDGDWIGRIKAKKPDAWLSIVRYVGTDIEFWKS